MPLPRQPTRQAALDARRQRLAIAQMRPCLVRTAFKVGNWPSLLNCCLATALAHGKTRLQKKEPGNLMKFFSANQVIKSVRGFPGGRL